MATPSSKNSCSPIPNRPANPRNSEVSNAMRRSFSGNPFAKPSSVVANQRPGFNPNPNTPANSPSGGCHPRRNSIGRENILVSLREFEDKENGKDQYLKQDRLRSPASLKGSKNFMSPTISAASKFNASPRKKILTERNEPIRTSASFSEENLDVKPQKGLTQKKEVSFDPIITYVEDNDALKSDKGSIEVSSTNEDWDLSSEGVTIADDCVHLDPSFKISPRASFSLPSSDLAPLDADPSMPPYDPKTNYTSPRPQFLHYKPNPRIEMYLRKGRAGKQLENSFASESSSETDVTEEEVVSEGSSTSSDTVERGLEELEEEEREEEEEEQGRLFVSEPKRVAKSNFFTRTKFTALLLVLLSACIWASVSKSPIMDPSVINNLSFSSPYVPPEISNYLRDLAQKFQQWVYESLSYTKKMIISFKERHKPITIQFANLTTLSEDGLVDNFLLVGKSAFSAEFKYENIESGLKSMGEAEYVSMKQKEHQSIEADENVEEEVVEGDNYETNVKIEEAVEDGSGEQLEEQHLSAAQDNIVDASSHSEVMEQVDHVVPESEDLNVTPEAKVTDPSNLTAEVIQERIESDADHIDRLVTEPSKPTVEVTQERPESAADHIERLQMRTNFVDQAAPVEQAAEVQQELSTNGMSSAESSAETESTILEEDHESLNSDAETRNPESTESATWLPIGISLVVLSLVSVVASIYMKNKTSTKPNAAITMNKVPLTKKLDDNPLSVTATGHTFQKRISSRNWQTEVETLAESCPSEMSSFQYSLSSRSKEGQKGNSEALSQERKPRRNSRRESLASSDYSTESPSYGSFTTYEKISSKNGNAAEEEVFTPVRRSSRIRKQVTSP